MSRSRADDVYRFTQDSLAEDHARHVDAVSQPTERPGPISEPEPALPNEPGRPAWSNRRPTSG